MKFFKNLRNVILFIFSISTFSFTENKIQSILTDTESLEALNFSGLFSHPQLGLSYTQLDSKELQKLQDYKHRLGSCAGYELLSSNETYSEATIEKLFNNFYLRDLEDRFDLRRKKSILKTKQSLNLLKKISVEELKNSVKWISSYPTRYYDSKKPNEHVDDLYEKLKKWTKNSQLKTQVDYISHKGIRQKSLRLRIEGKKEASKIIALGAHFDSTNAYFSFNRNAPGADDNASGSAAILEVARVILANNSPSNKSIEFFWYAGEEGGLIGSSQIAENYNLENKNVEAVLQIDMASFSGSGDKTIANMTDYTSKWLRDFLEEINIHYSLGLKILYDKCGYGCSDHASWYRQGFDTLMPSESLFNEINPHLHTNKDLINEQTNWTHLHDFTKIAMIFAQELANN